MTKRLNLFYRIPGLVSLLAVSAMAGAVCPPGSNWVATCGAGTYDVSAIFSNSLQLEAGVAASLGLPATIPLVQFTGDTTLIVSPPVGNTLAVDVHSIYATQIGGSAILRVGTGQGLQPSGGTITEESGTPALADSFFDIFFEIDFGNVALHNTTPLHLTSVLTELPLLNGTAFQEPNLPLNLYLSNGDLAGQLGPAAGFDPKVVTPEPGTWLLFGGGLLAAIGSGQRKRR